MLNILRSRCAQVGVRAALLGARPQLRIAPFRLASNAPRAASTAKLSEDFADGTSSVYVEEMYRSWQEDPSSVHKSWDVYFRSVDKGAFPGDAFVPPSQASPPSGGGGGVMFSEEVLDDSNKLQSLRRAYRVVGHRLSNLDPLGLHKAPVLPELDIKTYGWTEADLKKKVYLGHQTSGHLNPDSNWVTLGDYIQKMRDTYCGNIGIEYMHIPYRDQCDWIRDQMEKVVKYEYTAKEKEQILRRLAFTHLFERFLEKKHPGTKRFGLDGGESMIPGMKAMIDRGAELGVNEVVIGMAHRGRLNVLANVVRKPLQDIFSEFKGTELESEQHRGFSGDVKYHLGTSHDRMTPHGQVHISVVANPSHLEAVNPVVEGKVRGKQYFIGDRERKKVLPVLIHGDAAMAGQGVVSETLMLSELNGYRTGGTVHIVINNQIGFTTDWRDSRSSPYPTDICKSISVPIFHVNGDDPEAVNWVMVKAIEYRQRFGKDCVVDIWCYRRHGHNESDQPEFTQPLMYQKIRSLKPNLELYAEMLAKEGAVPKERYEQGLNDINEIYENGFRDSQNYEYKPASWLSSFWQGFKGPNQLSRIRNTGAKMDILQTVGAALVRLPESFSPHKTLVRLLKAKQKMFETGQGVDWATAEALAFGTLLLEGFHVRLSGQDVQRGTFSHRHAVVIDQKTNEPHTPLNHISPDQPETICVHNSSLSEFGVMGFELGYSLVSPNALVLWEAQFGDFANGAQVIIDQFLSCGELKWFRQCGLVLLLPHGYDGQGPEHSSARLERYLTLTNSNPMKPPTPELAIQQSNWQVVNVTTPANYFHVLRRQIHRQFRKPLIVMSPKSLLRHRLCVSRLDEFDDVGDDTRFFTVIGDTHAQLAEPSKVRRVVFCTGKIYFELLEAREEAGEWNVALVRIEQLAPFPFPEVKEQADLYPNAELMWCQEEPQNMGAYSFIFHHMIHAVPGRGKDLLYAGREPHAATATGSPLTHSKEQKALLNAAFAPSS